MARLVTCGWETGNVNEIGSPSGVAEQTVVSSTPTPRSPGTYCLKLGGTAGTPSNSAAQRNVQLPNPSDVWVRCAYYLHNIVASENYMALFSDSAGNAQGCLTWSPDQLLRVYRGSAISTGLLGTSTQQFTQDQWHTVELHWQIASTSTGTTELWVDGNRWLNLTGVDNSGTNVLNMAEWALGAATGSLNPSAYMAIDDLAINDTTGSINNGRIGDGRVVLLAPTGAGSTTAQTRGGTDTGANWSQTSEVPASMAQYVGSMTVGTRDTYALADVPAGNWGVNAVDVIAYAQKTEATDGSLGLTLKSGATTNEATAQPLNLSPAFLRQVYDTDPNTGAAWTVANVNALEAGTTVR